MNEVRNDKHEIPRTFIVVTAVYAFVAWGLFIAVVIS